MGADFEGLECLEIQSSIIFSSASGESSTGKHFLTCIHFKCHKLYRSMFGNNRCLMIDRAMSYSDTAGEYNSVKPSSWLMMKALYLGYLSFIFPFSCIYKKGIITLNYTSF